MEISIPIEQEWKPGGNFVKTRKLTLQSGRNDTDMIVPVSTDQYTESSSFCKISTQEVVHYVRSVRRKKFIIYDQYTESSSLYKICTQQVVHYIRSVHRK
ncbi:hypothetical protein ACF0H5_016159 [Mactra antiquata]